MIIKKPATIDDLFPLSIDGKAELVHGEIEFMSPTGTDPGFAGDAIFASLYAYWQMTKRGVPVGDNKGFIVDLPNRRSFSPDAAYFMGRGGGMKFFNGAPIFAVEVRSEGDYGAKAERDMAAKRLDYFAAGTLVVWDVDIQSEEVVRVYRKSDPENPTVYRRGELAEAEPALPGWTFSVDLAFLPENS